jgi:hypothetical protein
LPLSLPASVINLEGTEAGRPAAGILGRLYYATDTFRLFKDNGTAWNLLYGGGASATALVITSETTASTNYADLATAGPEVTVTIGPSGLCEVTVSSRMYNGAADTICYMAPVVDGGAGDDSNAAHNKAGSTTYGVVSRSTLYTGLSAGSHVFTAKYKVSGNTGTWVQRRIIAKPL